MEKTFLIGRKRPPACTNNTELEANEVGIAFKTATPQAEDLELDRYEFGFAYADHVEYKGDRLPIVPDRFMLLFSGDDPFYFFVELDRGTMPNQRFRMKIRAYHQYYQQGLFAKRYFDATTAEEVRPPVSGVGKRPHRAPPQPLVTAVP